MGTTPIHHETTGVTMEIDLLVYGSVENSHLSMGKDLETFSGYTAYLVNSWQVGLADKYFLDLLFQQFFFFNSLALGNILYPFRGLKREIVDAILLLPPTKEV